MPNRLKINRLKISNTYESKLITQKIVLRHLLDDALDILGFPLLAILHLLNNNFLALLAGGVAGGGLVGAVAVIGFIVGLLGLLLGLFLLLFLFLFLVLLVFFVLLLLLGLLFGGFVVVLGFTKNKGMGAVLRDNVGWVMGGRGVLAGCQELAPEKAQPQ